MPLPIRPLATGSVVIGGESVGFRSLSRSEAMKVGTWDKSDPDGAEVYILAHACDVTTDEATAFRDGTDFDTVTVLLTAILELSGLSTPEGKPDLKVVSNGR